MFPNLDLENETAIPLKKENTVITTYHNQIYKILQQQKSKEISINWSFISFLFLIMSNAKITIFEYQFVSQLIYCYYSSKFISYNIHYPINK